MSLYWNLFTDGIDPVPQSMSYATSLSNLPPQVGLYGATIPPIIYSVISIDKQFIHKLTFFLMQLLGTCRQLSVGPEAALSLIIGQAITKLLTEEEHAHGPFSELKKLKLALTIASVITFEAGLITFA